MTELLSIDILELESQFSNGDISIAEEADGY